MESRWYLAPGQTLQNTNISNRGHALHVSASAWKSITGHLDRKKLIAEAIEKERAHRQALKEGSDAMTKNWPDSIEYQHLRKEEERKKRLEDLEEQRMANYNQLRKEQADIKDEYMKAVKRRMFYAKSYPKELNGALLESEAIYERQKQLEFKKMIDAHNQEVEREYAESVKQAAADEEREKQEKAAQAIQKKQELKEIYLNAIEEKETYTKNKMEQRKKKELEDNRMAKAEMDLQEQIQREDMIKTRTERKLDLLNFLEENNHFKKMLKKEDDEVEDVIKVFEAAKHEIDCLRKEKLDEIRRQEVARREAAGKAAVAEAKAKDESVERNMKKAQEEADEREKAKEEARLERQKQLRKDREEDRQNYLKRKEEEDRRERERLKWEMLNRLKGDEVVKQYNDQKRKEAFEAKLKYRKELDEMEEIRKKAEYEDDSQRLADEFMMKKMKQEDDEFFNYANELIEYVKKNGRPTYPIVRVIKKYKELNHIIDEEDKNAKKDCEPSPQDKMLNTIPGKRNHDPRTDPNYRRCPCHKDEIIR